MTDVLTLLSDANPVRFEEVPQMSATLSDSILVRRGRPRVRVVLLVAVALAALAAGLIGVFASGGGNSHPGLGPDAVGPGAPLNSIPLADSSATLGAPVVLPKTALVQPSDASPNVRGRCPGDTSNECTIYVSFPAQALGISYTRPAPPDDYEADVATAPAHHAQGQLLDLGGVPALWIDYPGVKRLIEFVDGGTQVIVYGNYDEATLQAVAQSILDRSGSSSSSSNPQIIDGPGTAPTPVADAAAADGLLPFKVVLPTDATPTSLGVLKPSHQLDAYFDTPESGPYNLVEGPSTETLAMLRETAKRWTVGPIHEIDAVDGVDVLLQGSSDGSLVASWIRPDGGSRILTWIEGPQTAERGQVEGTFTKQQALAVARDIIGQGG